jgi:hypothetical protein
MGVSQRPAEQKAFLADMAAREADRKEALAIIEAWNTRLAAPQPELASPTLRAALISGYHWLHVICPACETSAEIDLRVVRRDPAMIIGKLFTVAGVPPVSARPACTQAAAIDDKLRSELDMTDKRFPYEQSIWCSATTAARRSDESGTASRSRSNLPSAGAALHGGSGGSHRSFQIKLA